MGALKYITVEGLCFISGLNIVYFVLIPLSIILMVTIILFILTIKSIKNTMNNNSKSNDVDNKENKDLANERRTIIVLAFSNGLTWLFGFLIAVPYPSDTNNNIKFILAIIFCILNAFQGAYIFFSTVGLREIILYIQRKQNKQSKYNNNETNYDSNINNVYETNEELNENNNNNQLSQFRMSEFNRIRPESFIELPNEKIYLNID